MDYVPLPIFDPPAIVAKADPALLSAFKPKADPLPPYPIGYPLRPSSTWWTGCRDWTHLTTGEHAGKFPAVWLQTLTNAQIQSLHSDAHEGRVDWRYVPARPPQLSISPKLKVIDSSPVYTLPASQSSCPSGNCPTAATGYFRRGLFR